MRFPAFLLLSTALVACSAEGPGTVAPDRADVVEVPAEYDFAQDISDLTMDEDILYGKLPNGVRYAVMSNDTPSATASLLMRFDTGSLDETDDTRGIAHFLEHMAFNGSENIPEGEMIKRLERLGLAFGPDTNASTGFDETIYQLELPDVTDELIQEGLSIFRETAERLTLDPEAIDRERGVILSEKRARNSPAFRAQIEGLEFQTEGLNLSDKLPIGTVETIESVTPEQFREFYESQYQPEDTFIVLVGDRPKEALAQFIEAAFADWTNDAPDVPDTMLPEISFDGPRYGSFFDPEVTSSVTLSTITQIAPKSERRDTAANRAARIPLSYANRIVNRRLARKASNGEASYTGAGTGVSDLFESAEIASLGIAAEPDKLRDGFIEAERILRQAIDHGFTQSELDELIANDRKSLEVAIQTAKTRRTPNLARQIMNAFSSERVITSAESGLERFDAFVADLTVEDAEAALREAWSALETAPQMYLQSDTVVEDPDVWLSSLLEESRSVTLPADLRDDVGEFAYTEWGEPGTVAERGRIEDIGIDTVVFDNGVRLNMKPTPYEDDVVRIRVRSGSGTGFYPQNKPAFGTQMSVIVGSSGLGAHTADDLSTLLAGRAVGARRSFGTRDMVIGGSTVPEDLELQMNLMAATLTDPAFRAETLPRFESQIRSVWSKLDSTPNGAADIEVPSILSSNHWSDVHPSEMQMLDIDLDALSSWYETHIDGAPIEIGVVGDFDPDEMTQQVASTFGALPDRAEGSPEVPASALDWVFPNGRVRPYTITHAGEPDTGSLSVYWPIDDHDAVERSRRLSMLSRVLRLELNEVLREEEGATYSPSAYTSMPDVNPNWGYVGVTIEAEPGELDRLTGIIESVAAKIAEEGVDADVFDRAIKPTLEGIETSYENNNYWLGVVDQAQTRPDTLDDFRSREKMFKSMTAEDVSSVANVLNPDRAIRVHVVPEG